MPFLQQYALEVTVINFDAARPGAPIGLRLKGFDGIVKIMHREGHHTFSRAAVLGF